MRKLDRTNIPAPNCLAQYNNGQQTWADVGAAEKAAIRAHLEQMQGRRCAYCEGCLDALGNHIEHFRPKGRHQHLTFDWSNLYWSCDKPDSCGHHKDNGAGAYNVADLIDPGCDDPDRYLKFRADGTINVRTGLSQNDDRKARETIRVFSLDAQRGRLRQMRKQAVIGYIADATAAIDAGCTVDEIRELFEDELRRTATSPFATAIRHVLTESA